MLEREGRGDLRDKTSISRWGSKLSWIAHSCTYNEDFESRPSSGVKGSRGRGGVHGMNLQLLPKSRSRVGSGYGAGNGEFPLSTTESSGYTTVSSIQITFGVES